MQEIGIFASTRCGYCCSDASSISHYYRLYTRRSVTESYLELIEFLGGRRCGHLYYTPCTENSCCQLQSVRIPIATFSASKSQRKALARALPHISRIDTLKAREISPEMLDREFALFQKYQERIHGEDLVDTTFRGFYDFLVNSPVDTCHQLYYGTSRDQDGNGRDADLLVGVGVLDRLSTHYLSSLYFFYDPDYWGTRHSKTTDGKAIITSAGQSISIGTAATLLEIQYGRQLGIRYYTLGLYSNDCEKLWYKTRFGPAEVFRAGCPCRASAAVPASDSTTTVDVGTPSPTEEDPWKNNWKPLVRTSACNCKGKGHLHEAVPWPS